MGDDPCGGRHGAPQAFGDGDDRAGDQQQTAEPDATTECVPVRGDDHARRQQDERATDDGHPRCSRDGAATPALVGGFDRAVVRVVATRIDVGRQCVGHV